MKIVQFLVLVLVFAAPLKAYCETALEITPDRVKQSVLEHYPSVLKEIANAQGARADILSAEGAFDTVFSASSRNRLTGYYNGQQVEGKFERNLSTMGGQVYGGYRISEGTFPVYEDLAFTNELGEFKIGAVFSLLKDRDIDERRFRLQDSQLALEQANLTVQLTQIGVLQKSLLAYWRWRGAASKLQIYENLLSIAEERQKGLELEVQKGARASIALTENAQNMTRRRVLVEEAKRELDIAALGLSLYLRTQDGQPYVPSYAEVPQTLKHANVPDQNLDLAVLPQHPELRALALDIKRIMSSRQLAENAMRPKLDLSVEASNDFGSIAEGGQSRDDPEAVIGLKFSIPLGQRDARGKIAKANAKLRSLKHERRLREDEIVMGVQKLRVQLDTAQNSGALTAEEVEHAVAMRNAEERRFENGASDFFLVNLREESLANAEIRYVNSVISLNAASVSFDAATLTLGDGLM
jgi:outer membrane protein TolC